MLAGASATSAYAPPAASDSLTVSLITCWPGDDVYELCGHSALRVRGEGIDSVWNYGTFDFAAPNFVWRFVKGETDYMLAAYPFPYFMPEYIAGHRRVVEQDLNLTQAQARSLLNELRREALPQNCVYRYNYVRNNCATKIVDVLDRDQPAPIVYTDSIRYGTFREEMRSFHKNYPWYQFGIDIALGSGLDTGLRGRDEMFVPIDMMKRFATARMADGTPLVRATRVLNEGDATATLPPTPWWLTPMTWSIACLLLTVGICIYSGVKKRIVRWWWTLYFLLCGVAGCIVAFLVFFSRHEATSPNALIVWLNPLQFLTALCVWWRAARPVELAMNWMNIIAVGVLMLVWPFQPQSANPAFFPLMACAVALGVTYAIIYPKTSYNSNPTSRSASAPSSHPKPKRKPRSATGKR